MCSEHGPRRTLRSYEWLVFSNYINENLLSAKPLRRQRDEAKSLVAKWDRTGLLDGLKDDCTDISDLNTFLPY